MNCKRYRSGRFFVFFLSLWKDLNKALNTTDGNATVIFSPLARRFVLKGRFCHDDHSDERIERKLTRKIMVGLFRILVEKLESAKDSESDES